MKLILTILTFCIMTVVVHAQRQVKVFLDKDLKVVQSQNESQYYRIILYNKDNKTGTLKNFYSSGKLLSTGKFLSINELDATKDVLHGEVIGYFENGKIFDIRNYENGVIKGLVKRFNKEGAIAFEIPFVSGGVDSSGIKEYMYHDNVLFAILSGCRDSDDKITGVLKIFKNGQDTILNFYYKRKLKDIEPIWTAYKSVKDKKMSISYIDNFDYSNIGNQWFNSAGEIKTEDKKLKLKLPSGNLETAQVLIAYTPVLFYKKDFSISVNIDVASASLSQGIEFGVSEDGKNLIQVSLLPMLGEIEYLRVEDGVHKVDKYTDKIHFRKSSDNTLMVKRIGTTLNIYVNGTLALEDTDFYLKGNELGLFALGKNEYNTAIFSKFDVSLESTEVSPNLIPVKRVGSLYTVPTTLNEVLKIDFIFDSGASDVSISPDIALTLVKTGTIQKEDWLEGAYYMFADGSIAKSKRFKLKSLRIGNKTIYNVTCSISNSINAPMLLGQSVLNKFGRYIFNNKALTLTLE